MLDIKEIEKIAAEYLDNRSVAIQEIVEDIVTDKIHSLYTVYFVKQGKDENVSYLHPEYIFTDEEVGEIFERAEKAIESCIWTWTKEE